MHILDMTKRGKMSKHWERITSLPCKKKIKDFKKETYLKGLTEQIP